MFLPAILLVLFMTGCWLYCLADAALTPAAEFPGVRKPVWITVIGVTFILGAIAWVIARTSWRDRYWPAVPSGYLAWSDQYAPNVRWYPHHPPYRRAGADDSLLAAEALARHPASQARRASGRPIPIGPDDDPEFLRLLAERIRGEQ